MNIALKQICTETFKGLMHLPVVVSKTAWRFPAHIPRIAQSAYASWVDMRAQRQWLRALRQDNPNAARLFNRNSLSVWWMMYWRTWRMPINQLDAGTNETWNTLCAMAQNPNLDDTTKRQCYGSSESITDVVWYAFLAEFFIAAQILGWIEGVSASFCHLAMLIVVFMKIVQNTLDMVNDNCALDAVRCIEMLAAHPKTPPHVLAVLPDLMQALALKDINYYWVRDLHMALRRALAFVDGYGASNLIFSDKHAYVLALLQEKNRTTCEQHSVICVDLLAAQPINDNAQEAPAKTKSVG